MAKKSTFRLNLPADKQLELYRVQLADGTTVDRYLADVTALAPGKATAPRG